MGHRLGTVRCRRSILLGLVFLLGFLLPALTAAAQPRVADARRSNLARVARGLPLGASVAQEQQALVARIGHRPTKVSAAKAPSGAGSAVLDRLTRGV